MIPKSRAKDLEKVRDIACKNIESRGLNLIQAIPNIYMAKFIEDNFLKVFPDQDPAEVFGTFNDFGFRSDDFIKDHDGLHVLFVGCSITFGEGMPQELTWPRMVYDYLAKTNKLSGFFNLGKSGSNFSTMLSQIFGYSSEFGVPNVIFLNVPEIGREFLSFNLPMRKAEDMSNHKIDPGHNNTIEIYERNLGILKDFAKIHNIKLYIGSWDIGSAHYNQIIEDYGSPFSGIDIINCAEPVDLSPIEKMYDGTPHQAIHKEAFDESHPGIAGHYAMAQHYIKALLPLHD